MNPTSSSVMPSVTTGARPISGTSTSNPRCSEFQRRARVRPPPPMSGGDGQAEGSRDPAVDRRDGDDVHVPGRDAGRGQRDRPDSPAGPPIQPSADGHQRHRQYRARSDADLGPQNARLCGEHQQQDDPDQGDSDTRHGECLADPTLITRRFRRCRLRRHRGCRERRRSGALAAGTAAPRTCIAAARTEQRAAAAMPCDRSRSSSVRLVDARVSCWEMAAKSAESREITARCGSVMLVMIATTRPFADE